MVEQQMILVTRRGLLLSGAAMVLGAGVLPRQAWAADPIKVAGIYTVPVEQQWVSRIHKAAEAAKAAGAVEYTYTENVANTDYARVMREYAESGVQLIVGEIFGAEEEAREVCAETAGLGALAGRVFDAVLQFMKPHCDRSTASILTATTASSRRVRGDLRACLDSLHASR